MRNTLKCMDFISRGWIEGVVEGVWVFYVVSRNTHSELGEDTSSGKVLQNNYTNISTYTQTYVCTLVWVLCIKITLDDNQVEWNL